MTTQHNHKTNDQLSPAPAESLPNKKMGDHVSGREISLLQEQIAQLQNELNEAHNALAKCRDLLAPPQEGAHGDREWRASMANPSSVPLYLRTMFNKPQTDLEKRCQSIIDLIDRYQLDASYQARTTIREKLMQELSVALAPRVNARGMPASPFTCWSSNEGDSWHEHPADAQIIEDILGAEPKVGDEIELRAGWNCVTARYRVTEVDADGDCDVECISHPHEGRTTPLTTQDLKDLLPLSQLNKKPLVWMTQSDALKYGQLVARTALQKIG